MKNENNKPVIYKLREVLTDLYSDSGKRLISFSVIGLIVNIFFAVFNGYVGLASAISLLSLQAALFFSFGDPTSAISKRFNLITGGAVWCIILGIAIETLWTRKKRS